MIDNLLNTRFKGKISDQAKFYDKFYQKNNRLETMNDPNNPANKEQYLFMLEYLNVPFDKGKKLLDVACGGGGFLYFADKRVSTYGIEISQVCLRHAKELSSKSIVKKAKAEKLPFKNRQFDFVTCLGSLEHFLDPLQALNEMRRVLKPKGKVLVYVPNIFFIFGVLQIGLFGGAPSHSQEIERFNTMDGWQNLIESCRFKVIKRSGYNPLFPFKGADLMRPLAFMGKTGWFLLRNLLPPGLSYNLVYVAMKE